jgi:hypothetical protein
MVLEQVLAARSFGRKGKPKKHPHQKQSPPAGTLTLKSEKEGEGKEQSTHRQGPQVSPAKSAATVAAPFLSIQCASACRGTGRRTRTVGVSPSPPPKGKIPFGGKGRNPNRSIDEGHRPPTSSVRGPLLWWGERKRQREKRIK